MIQGIGNRIRVLREERGLNQKELALRAGVHQASLSRIESGKILDPLSGTVGPIAEALEVSLTFLLTGQKISTQIEFGF